MLPNTPESLYYRVLSSQLELPNYTKHCSMTLQRKHGDAKGGPFVAAHLRRADFLYARPDDVPSLEHTAKQLKEVLDKQKLKTIFIATDAPKEGRPIIIFLTLCFCA